MINTTGEMMFRLDNLNAEQRRLSYQSSTGKVLDNGSDNATLYSREIYVDDKIKVFEGLQSQLEKSQVLNKSSDTALAEAKKLLDFVKVEVKKGLNDTTDPDAKEAIAKGLEGVKENLFSLANTIVDGQYVFSGIDASIKPFEMDDDGKVTYKGDSDLRRVAVDEGTYRDRGSNGFEMMMYNFDVATFSDPELNFSSDERILDQDGNEWVKHKPVAAGNVISVTNQQLVDKDDKKWNLNTTNTPPELVDADGNVLATANEVPPVGSGNYDFDAPNGEYQFTVPANNTLAYNQLVRYDEDNELVDGAALNISGEEPELSVTVPVGPGVRFEAKKSIFDVLDQAINSLRSKDYDGVPIEDDTARENLSKTLDELNKSYDAVNVAHANLGSRNKIFEISLESVNAKVTQYNILSQEIGAVDLGKVAMELKALELTYTSLYSTINRTNQLSLTNFLN